MSNPTVRDIIKYVAEYVAVSLLGRTAVRLIAGIATALVVIFSVGRAEGEEMIFDADKNIIIALLVVGILFVLFVRYYFKFQDFKKEANDVAMKFDVIYGIAFVISVLASVAVAYIIVFDGFKYVSIETVIEELNVIIISCLAIGAVIAYIIDRCIVHPVFDGTIVAVENRKKLVSMKGSNGKVFIDPVVKSKIVAKGKLYGLNDEQCERLALLVKSENDPQFATIAGFVKKN